jgi:hypothetical protein
MQSNAQQELSFTSFVNIISGYLKKIKKNFFKLFLSQRNYSKESSYFLLKGLFFCFPLQMKRVFHFQKDTSFESFHKAQEVGIEN